MRQHYETGQTSGNFLPSGPSQRSLNTTYPPAQLFYGHGDEYLPSPTTAAAAATLSIDLQAVINRQELLELELELELVHFYQL